MGSTLNISSAGSGGGGSGIVAHALTIMEVLCGKHATMTILLREVAGTDSRPIPCMCLGVKGPRLLQHADLSL
jgi:hypothetical protein